MLREALTAELGLDDGYIDKLARTASHRYKEYAIPKRDGGLRQIHHPAKQLKAVQRWIKDNVVALLPVHEAAAAYVRGAGIAEHARRHQHSRYLLRVDLEDFFPSITADDVADLLESARDFLPVGWVHADTNLLSALVCRHGRLTIGAVTSPGLSNAACFQLDTAVALQCKQEITYSRYADDLFFSTVHPHRLGRIPDVVAEVISQLSYPKHLRINPSKTRHSSMKRRRRITGLILTSDGQVSVGRHQKRWIRGQVHRLERLTPAERARLAGYLAYVRDVEPTFFTRLVTRYGPRAILAATPPAG